MGPFDTGSLSFDWFILALRLAFIALIYIFLYQVARVSIRELGAIAAIAEEDRPQQAGAALEVVDPADSSLGVGARFPLGHYSTIGRAADNSIVLDDAFVSGSHAQVTFDGGSWWLRDLGSTNGTELNGAPVHSAVEVRDGDVVQFGRVRMLANV